MRICLLSRSTPIHGPGGFEKYIFDLARGLTGLGHEVHIITKHLPTIRSAEEVSELDGFYLHWVGPRNQIVWYSFPFFFEMGKKLAELNREHPFDIIHSNNRAAFAMFLVRPTDKWPPLVTTAHGTSLSEFLDFPWKISEMPRRYVRILPLVYCEYVTFTRSTKIICITPRVQVLIEKQNPRFRKKCVLIYNGVQHQIFHPEPKVSPSRAKESPITILYTGTITASKGVLTLYRAFHNLYNKYPHLRLRLVGGGPLLNSLKESAFRDHIQDRVIFDGYQPPDRMPVIYREANIFVLPAELQEGFSFSILEALSSGLAVIASSKCFVDQLFKKTHCGLIYDAGNEIQLGEKIEALLQNPNLSKDLGKTGRNVVIRRFTTESMIKSVERVYHEVLASKNTIH